MAVLAWMAVDRGCKKEGRERKERKGGREEGRKEGIISMGFGVIAVSWRFEVKYLGGYVGRGFCRLSVSDIVMCCYLFVHHMHICIEYFLSRFPLDLKFPGYFSSREGKRQ